MKVSLQQKRKDSEAIELLAQKTIDKGITEESLIIAVANELFHATQDLTLKQFCHKHLSLRRAYNLRKLRFKSGVFEGKKAVSTKRTIKHTVDVLKQKGYDFRFANNLDFLQELFKKYEIPTFLEFVRIIKEKDPEFLNSYYITQIEAMTDYGHLDVD